MNLSAGRVSCISYLMAFFLPLMALIGGWAAAGFRVGFVLLQRPSATLD